MSTPNNINRDLFILGEPIETQFGRIRFLTYSEYLKYNEELTLIGMNILHFYNQYSAFAKSVPKEDKAEFNKMLKALKESSLYDFVVNNDSTSEAYYKIFRLVLDEDDEEEANNKILRIIEDEKSFNSMRHLIMDMNFIVEDPVSDNPEIQEYYDDRKKQKARESGKQTVSDIITSIVAGSSNSFADVRGWTVIQVYNMYYRIAAFKGYDTSVLFATVGSKEKIEPWYKNIDLFEEQSLGINYEEFSKKYGGLFD